MMQRAASPKILPFQATEILLKVATSELMLSKSEKIVLALLVIPQTGIAEVNVEARRRGRRVLTSCILKYEWC
jgi:hypothetical protein